MEQQDKVVLPGDPIDPAAIPSHPKKPLQLGPGLRLATSQTIQPTVAGTLITDRKKNSLWIEFSGGRYAPATGDLIIGQVHHSAADHHHVSLTPYTSHALLPVLAFENASKKTRPALPPGSLVYARVSLCNRHMDPELECVDPATGRADGLGPLAGGTVFSVGLGMARRLAMGGGGEGQGGRGGGGVVVLEELGAQGLVFEVAVGRNGRLWVCSEDVRTVVLVGRAVTETDEGKFDVPAQKKLVRKLVRAAGGVPS